MIWVLSIVGLFFIYSLGVGVCKLFIDKFGPKKGERNHVEPEEAKIMCFLWPFFFLLVILFFSLIYPVITITTFFFKEFPKYLSSTNKED